MNFNLPDLSYINGADECYKTIDSFDLTIQFISESLKEYGVKAIEQDTVIVQLPDGVFIRTRVAELAIALDSLSDSQDPKIGYEKLPDVNSFFEITTKYKIPINIFGDGKLVRWRVGF